MDRLPAVRVPTVPTTDDGEGGIVTETPLVDLPPSEKFGFAWPDKGVTPPIPPIPIAVAPPGLLPASVPPPTDSELSELESEAESQDSKEGHSHEGEHSEATPTGESPKASRPSMSSSPPRFSRAFSTPVSSQLGHLKNPHRTPAVIPRVDGYFAQSQSQAAVLGRILPPPKAAQFQELSLELADSVQTMIQTLLQILPPHLLDPAKEQFSACSLSVPSPSISAMLTAMKNLNYMSANLSNFAENEQGPQEELYADSDLPLHSPILDDFDVGEMLQSVGDVLSGFAAQNGIELVLFHGDVGMKHVSVRADECGISSTLSYMIRQIADTAEEGDTLEVGLFITPESLSGSQTQGNGQETRSPSRSSNPRDFDGPLRVTFELGHKFVTPPVSEEGVAGPSSVRRKPKLNASFFKRLLRQVGGSIKEDLPPRMFSHGRSYELSIVLEPGSTDITSEPPKLSAEEQASRQPYAAQNIELAAEPSLDELNAFLEQLKGKKVALHASDNGSFAHHLTSYLTAWGLDVSHMSHSGSLEDDTMSDSTSAASNEDSQKSSPSIMMTDSPAPMEVNPVELEMRAKVSSSNPSFVIIDDNVNILRNRLNQLRSESTFNLSLRQRPKLSAHHRPKSSPQIYRAKGVKPSFAIPQAGPHPVIIHFTSLPNYKVVKDLIHSTLSTPGSSSLIPEVIVLLKPAGPRRVLTALRTAVVKPIVDPFFMPIATSPMSPSGHGVSPYFPLGKDKSPTQKVERPTSPRSASDKSTRTVREQIEHANRLPPSPLRESESLEYFSEAAEKLGTSPSSGLVIQSPDGQPAGIFFHPRGPGNRLLRRGADSSSPSLQGVMRDGSALRPPVEVRRRGSRRNKNKNETDIVTPGERPKPFSRATGSFRHKMFASSETEPPSEFASPLGSPALNRGGRLATPRDEFPLPQMITSAVSPTPVAGQSGNKNSTSPPISPAQGRSIGTPVPRRSFTRKGADTSLPSPPVKKTKPSTDGNIVPPVNVLIVEDNPINQTILSTFMKKKKIKYDVAKNGAEAVAKWKTGGFHLILMDIQMPVMDGIEATKEIRRLERQTLGNTFGLTPPLDGQQTPSDLTTESRSTGVQTPYRSSVIIVALTASSLQADRVSALAAGCNDFLTKPVSLQWLNNKIIEWGSIKALQMWADLRPEVVKSISAGQATQAKNVADRLRVPEKRKSAHSSTAPTPKPAPSGPSPLEAMRLLSLSTPSRRATSQEVDMPDSEYSDTDRSPAPLNRGTAASSQRSESAESDKEITVRMAAAKLLDAAQDKGPTTFKEVSGEDALKTHMADQATLHTSEGQKSSLRRPILLGEANLSEEGRPSIAEVMHKESQPANTLETDQEHPNINVSTDGSNEPSATDKPPPKSDSK